MPSHFTNLKPLKVLYLSKFLESVLYFFLILSNVFISELFIHIYMFYFLHFFTDGDIGVGREGEELPFIAWVDPDPLPLTVISFSAWSGIEAKWYFDCQRPTDIQVK